MYVTGRAMKKGLFLGAGFSYDLGMPLASELTETFLNMFTPRDVGALGLILSSKEPFGKDRPINKQAITAGLNLLLEYKEQNTKNYEALLADLESLKGIENPIQSDRDSSHFLFGIFTGSSTSSSACTNKLLTKSSMGAILAGFAILKICFQTKKLGCFR